MEHLGGGVEVVDLGAAGESIGKDNGLRGEGAQRREELRLGYRYGHLVVATFGTEVSGQATATTDRRYLGAGSLQKCTVGVPADHGMVMTVGLRGDLQA